MGLETRSSRIGCSARYGLACAVLLASALSSACGGGGGGAVGSITAPDLLELAGTYVGDSTLEKAAGCGCVGPEVVVLDPEQGESPLFQQGRIRQNGAAIDGFLDILWPPEPWGPGRCEFVGTVDAHTFSAEATQCKKDPIVRNCSNGQSWTLVLGSLRWQAVEDLDYYRNLDPSDPVIFGDWSGTWDCFDTGTGAAKGTLKLSGGFTFRESG